MVRQEILRRGSLSYFETEMSCFLKYSAILLLVDALLWGILLFPPAHHDGMTLLLLTGCGCLLWLAAAAVCLLLRRWILSAALAFNVAATWFVAMNLAAVSTALYFDRSADWYRFVDTQGRECTLCIYRDSTRNFYIERQLAEGLSEESACGCAVIDGGCLSLVPDTMYTEWQPSAACRIAGDTLYGFDSEPLPIERFRHLSLFQ